MKKYFITFLLVILDPYRGLKYDEINTYIIEEECFDDCIGYTQSEFMDKLQAIEQQYEAFNQETDLAPAYQDN